MTARKDTMERGGHRARDRERGETGHKSRESEFRLLWQMVPASAAAAAWLWPVVCVGKKANEPKEIGYPKSINPNP